MVISLYPKTYLMAKASKKQATASTSNYKSGVAAHDSMLKEFFTDELKDIYWAEKHVVTTLPKLKKAATSTELQKAFDDHTEQSKNQVVRLEQVFQLLGKKAQSKKCDAMAGIIEEAKSIISDTDKGTATRDVGLILAAQKVEHYEISTYGGLRQLAVTLGLNEVAKLLGETLEEEKQTDVLLTQIAENSVNYAAADEEE